MIILKYVFHCVKEGQWRKNNTIGEKRRWIGMEGESFLGQLCGSWLWESAVLTLKFCWVCIIPILLGEKISLRQLCVLVFSEVFKTLRLLWCPTGSICCPESCCHVGAEKGSLGLAVFNTKPTAGLDLLSGWRYPIIISSCILKAFAVEFFPIWVPWLLHYI